MKNEKNRKKLKKIIRQIERDNHPPGYHRAVRKLRKEESDASGEAKFKRWKKKHYPKEV